MSKESKIVEVEDALIKGVELVALGGLAFVAYEMYKDIKGFGKNLEGDAESYFGFDRTDPCETPKWYTWLSFVGIGKNLKDKAECSRIRAAEVENAGKARRYINEDGLSQDDYKNAMKEIKTNDKDATNDDLAVAGAIRVEFKKYLATNDQKYLRRASELRDMLAKEQLARLTHDLDFDMITEAINVKVDKGIEDWTDNIGGMGGSNSALFNKQEEEQKKDSIGDEDNASETEPSSTSIEGGASANEAIDDWKRKINESLQSLADANNTNENF